MASFNFEIPQELQKQIETLSDIDDIAPKMIDGAIPVLVKSFQKNIPKDTGGLAKSVKAVKAKKVKNGAYVGNVVFRGKEKKENGKPYSVIAIFVNHGTSRTPARPFVTKSVNDAEKEVTEKMQEVYNEEMNLK